MRESIIEKEWKRKVALAGGKSYKFVSPGENGVADQIAFMPEGRTVLAETKTPVGRLSDQQKQFIQDLADRGHRVYVPKTVFQICKILESEVNTKAVKDVEVAFKLFEMFLVKNSDAPYYDQLSQSLDRVKRMLAKCLKK